MREEGIDGESGGLTEWRDGAEEWYGTEILMRIDTGEDG